VKEEIKKEVYETPSLEVIEFLLEESIAISGDYGAGTLCSEEVF